MERARWNLWKAGMLMGLRKGESTSTGPFSKSCTPRSQITSHSSTQELTGVRALGFNCCWKEGRSYLHAQRLSVFFLHSNGSLIQQGPCCVSSGLVTTASGEHKPSGLTWENSLSWRCAHIASFRSFLMGELRTKDVPTKPTHPITGALCDTDQRSSLRLSQDRQECADTALLGSTKNQTQELCGFSSLVLTCSDSSPAHH